MTLVADGNCWALDEWEEDTVPDRNWPQPEEVIDERSELAAARLCRAACSNTIDELAALFLREAA